MLDTWNDGETKSAIVEFVRQVTAEGGSDYVEPALRVAVFDNDGTLWCEKPAYIQLDFWSAASPSRPPPTRRYARSSLTGLRSRAI